MINIIPPIRQSDAHGNGAYGAPRGKKTHRGVDIACYKGSKILSNISGVVSKIGYPYSPSDKKKGHLRYVEVTELNGARHRYFYISSKVNVGDVVYEGRMLGIAQGLLSIYPDITDHIHYEIIHNGVYIDPTKYLPEY